MIPYRSIGFLVCLFAAASAQELSNGERLARGLPPRRPERMFDPDRPRALQPRQSGTASTEVTVNVGVSYYAQTTTEPLRRDTAASSLGYLVNTANGPVGLTTDTSLAASLTFASDASGDYNLIEYSNPSNAQYFVGRTLYLLLGYTTVDTTSNVGDGGNNCLALSYTLDVYDIGYHTIQDRIFVAPATGGMVVATWTNSDGTTVNPNWYYDSTKNGIRAAALGSDCGLSESDRVDLTFMSA